MLNIFRLFKQNLDTYKQMMNKELTSKIDVCIYILIYINLY